MTIYEADGGVFLAATTKGRRRVNLDGGPMIGAPIQGYTSRNLTVSNPLYGNPRRARGNVSMEVALLYRYTEDFLVIWRSILERNLVLAALQGEEGLAQLAAVALRRGAGGENKPDPAEAVQEALERSEEAGLVEADPADAAGFICRGLFLDVPPNPIAQEAMRLLAVQALRNANVPAYAFMDIAPEEEAAALASDVDDMLASLDDLGF